MSWDDYFITLASDVAKKSSCSSRQVGAVITRANHLISCGYNGTPSGAVNCNRGGCVRCQPEGKCKSGENYDKCSCLHAEHNAILMLSRFGGSGAQDCKLYSTLEPCLNCLALCVQVGISSIYYSNDFPGLQGSENKDQYDALSGLLSGGLHKV